MAGKGFRTAPSTSRSTGRRATASVRSCRGVSRLRVYGDANDYVGKGLSGGRIVVRPSDNAPVGYVAEDNIIGGNVILFGATSGQAFLRGVVGERFAVRNSGAEAVVEGVGDHGCEYMTGGKVVILGATGRNFAAGMSGGMAYVYDPDGVLPDNLNGEMVDLDALDEADLEWLHEMITAHVDATDSAVGQRVLADWPGEQQNFVKVMPRDYKRVPGCDRRGRSRRRGRQRGDHGGRSWVIRAASSSTPIAKRRSAGRCPCACGTGKRSTKSSSTTP